MKSAYTKNPTISRFRKKKHFLEANNIKVKILKQHFTSDQYQVEYINSKGIVKHKWIHKTELFMGNTTNLESSDINERGTNITQFNVQDYNKLLANFEQHIAEKWCNSRKMQHKLLEKYKKMTKITLVNLIVNKLEKGNLTVPNIMVNLSLRY